MHRHSGSDPLGDVTGEGGEFLRAVPLHGLPDHLAGGTTCRRRPAGGAVPLVVMRSGRANVSCNPISSNPSTCATTTSRPSSTHAFERCPKSSPMLWANRLLPRLGRMRLNATSSSRTTKSPSWRPQRECQLLCLEATGERHFR